jgi:3-phenylpropionate/cinnamic acid dioxygenase small subunit
MNLDSLLAEREIQHVLYRYARACDERDWAGFEHVFAENAEADYGGAFQFQGRTAIVASIRSLLGGCGPSHHLMGNPEVGVEGDGALARVYVRAFHRGAGEKANLTYECFGEYEASLRKLPEGWRVVHWRMRVDLETGTQEVLGPG